MHLLQKLLEVRRKLMRIRQILACLISDLSIWLLLIVIFATSKTNSSSSITKSSFEPPSSLFLRLLEPILLQKNENDMDYFLSVVFLYIFNSFIIHFATIVRMWKVPNWMRFRTATATVLFLLSVAVSISKVAGFAHVSSLSRKICL